MTETDLLRDFFVKVSEDEGLFERYKKNPEQVLREQGLSAETIRAVTAGDLRSIKRLLGKPEFPGLIIVIVQTQHR